MLSQQKLNYLLLCIFSALASVATTEQCESDQTSTENGSSCINKYDTSIGDEKDTKDYYKRASHYDKLWGKDSLHLGYYPHLALDSQSRIELTPAQSGIAMTEKMISLSNISMGDRVLDLGSGKGLSCAQIASMTGASCTGIDLTPANIERGNEIARTYPDLQISYFQGSFTSIPQSALVNGLYDVVFSQVAFSHAHDQLDLIFEEILRVLKPGGIVVVNDYLGGNSDPSDETKEHVYKRLHFTKLHGHQAWRRMVDEAGNGKGFELIYYENLDIHMEKFYNDLVTSAREMDFVSTDGAKLADNYEISARAIAKKEIGMNLCILRRT